MQQALLMMGDCMGIIFPTPVSGTLSSITEENQAIDTWEMNVNCISFYFLPQLFSTKLQELFQIPMFPFCYRCHRADSHKHVHRLAASAKGDDLHVQMCYPRCNTIARTFVSPQAPCFEMEAISYNLPAIKRTLLDCCCCPSGFLSYCFLD